MSLELWLAEVQARNDRLRVPCALGPEQAKRRAEEIAETVVHDIPRVLRILTRLRGKLTYLLDHEDEITHTVDDKYELWSLVKKHLAAALDYYGRE